MTCLKQGIKAVQLTSVMRTFPDVAGHHGFLKLRQIINSSQRCGCCFWLKETMHHHHTGIFSGSRDEPILISSNVIAHEVLAASRVAAPSFAFLAISCFLRRESPLYPKFRLLSTLFHSRAVFFAISVSNSVPS